MLLVCSIGCKEESIGPGKREFDLNEGKKSCKSANLVGVRCKRESMTAR